MVMKVTAGALLIVLGLAWALPCSTLAAEQPEAVSIIQLISNPGVYDGKLVRRSIVDLNLRVARSICTKRITNKGSPRMGCGCR